ncbi:hypothetical protein PHET_12275 [Paragonimus heterotremus]|uniref:Uncharacterized protein n=1 Tax=Paragonimus heterotremus TaxID=100268 RepID=A0A8J4WCK2_9TREM|nr:hypothetical protein PHET_12275 [Paragonimus heterotremus]
MFRSTQSYSLIQAVPSVSDYLYRQKIKRFRCFVRTVCKLQWIREEALADIVAVELVDLPVSESQARMEEEFGHTHGNLVEMFVKRFRTQAAQLWVGLLYARFVC